MSGNLSDSAELLILDWLNGAGSPARPTLPLKVRLMTANGSDSTAGTEVTGGTYTPQSVTFSAASGGSAANTTTLDFTGMPACTVVGVEVWDSAATPVRVWYGPLAADKTLLSGDTFQLAPAAILTSLD